MKHRRRTPTCAPALLRAARWLTALAVLLAVLTRPLVLCTGDDGVTHVEFAHAEGECCLHEAWLLPPVDDGEPEPAAEADPGCLHFDLAIDVAPKPTPDANAAPPLAPLAAESPCAAAPRLRARDATAPPHATGPPRPPAFLREHATVVLLL